MDADQVNAAAQAFEERRVDRMRIAQQHIKEHCGSLHDILADVANLMMFYHIATSVKAPKSGFRSTMEQPGGPV